jgi:methyl-accepting chemotaxis protein
MSIPRDNSHSNVSQNSAVQDELSDVNPAIMNPLEKLLRIVEEFFSNFNKQPVIRVEVEKLIEKSLFPINQQIEEIRQQVEQNGKRIEQIDKQLKEMTKRVDRLEKELPRDM